MKIIKLKCPSCNANLEINSERNNSYCKYCGAKLILEDEKETKAERIIKSLGKEMKKSREYYSSNEYKERLKIQNEQTKKTFKLLGIFLIVYVILMLFLLNVNKLSNSLTKTKDLTCNLNNKEYIIVVETKKEIMCASCEEYMLKELNDKYLNKQNINITIKNIKSYFKNNSGTCN